MDKILLLSVFYLLGVEATVDKKNWIYELTEVNTKTSNPDLININLNVERIRRGVFALSGEFFINLDINEGDGNELEVKAYRSTNGDGDYIALPFEMSRSHIYDVLNNHYKDILMETFRYCSNLPHFIGEFSPPLEKKTYTLDKCKFSQDGMPNIMETGVYKIVLSGYGDVDWEVEVVAAIEANDE